MGYLSYDRENRLCRIPNREVSAEFKNAIVTESGWNIIADTIKQSEQLLKDTIEGNNDAVATVLNTIHTDTSILKYNDENSLACVLTIAYYTAKKDYLMIRELPSGKGFADIVLLPRPSRKIPAVVLELKYNQSADTAIKQIYEKRYAGVLKDFAGEIVLVGINYDAKSKRHECEIEKFSKG